MVLVTLGRLSESWGWEKFCETKGYNPFCLSEGGDESATVRLSVAEAKTFGILSSDSDSAPWVIERLKQKINTLEAELEKARGQKSDEWSSATTR